MCTRIHWQRLMLKTTTKQKTKVKSPNTPQCSSRMVQQFKSVLLMSIVSHSCCSHFLEWSWGWKVMQFLDLLQISSKQWKFYQCGSHCLMYKRCTCCLILHSLPISSLVSLSGHLQTGEFATYTETKYFTLECEKFGITLTASRAFISLPVNSICSVNELFCLQILKTNFIDYYTRFLRLQLKIERLWPQFLLILFCSVCKRHQNADYFLSGDSEDQLWSNTVTNSPLSPARSLVITSLYVA